MNAELIGERLLTESAPLAEHTKVAAHRPLKVALHIENGGALLLGGLQTNA